MKPANFPDRVRRRQLRADKRNNTDFAPPASQRGIRTKKQLAGGSQARRDHHAGKLTRSR